MKNLLFLLIFLGSTLSPEEVLNPGGGVADLNDKEFLLNYLEETYADLQEKTRGLSAAQLQYKPSEDRWSIGECLEHIILTEEMLFQMNRDLMEQPVNASASNENKTADDAVLAGITNRSTKVKASQELTGANNYTSSETALEDLATVRRKIKDYIQNIPQEEFRNRFTDSPFGRIDAYQAFLFIPGHTARHTLQIEEVKQEPSFPRE